MPLPDTTKVFGPHTVCEWKALRSSIYGDPEKNSKVEGGKLHWVFQKKPLEDALEWFELRTELRFLNPIDRILNLPESEREKGEGFAAAALQCILVEHFAAFRAGEIYAVQRYDKGKQEIPRCPFEYSSSKSLFRSFLTMCEPFKQHFTDKLAEIFYDKIRCGLVHEAATKGLSTINAAHRMTDAGKLVELVGDSDLKFNRSAFHKALKTYLKLYKKELLTNPDLAANFLRKMDDICQIRRVFTFAYGRNLNFKVLRSRVGIVHWAGRATLCDYKLEFTKRSSDGTAKANVTESIGSKVERICYELDKESQHDDSNSYEDLEKVEVGYKDKELTICYHKDGNQIKALSRVFVAENHETGLKPSKDYLGDIIKGAKQWSLPRSSWEDLEKLRDSLQD